MTLTRTQKSWLGRVAEGEGEIPLPTFTALVDAGLVREVFGLTATKGRRHAELTATGRTFLGLPSDSPKKSRQVRRAEERRAGKPAPGPIQMKARTAARRNSATKGQPYSRCQLADFRPGLPGRPAILKLHHPTKGTQHTKIATPALVRTFFPSLPDNLAAAMLGQ